DAPGPRSRPLRGAHGGEDGLARARRPGPRSRALGLAPPSTEPPRAGVRERPRGGGRHPRPRGPDPGGHVGAGVRGRLRATAGRAAAALRFAPGQPFGDRYTLVEEIGAGGMGHVYKAIDVRLGKTVALKLVRAGFADQEQTIERFRRELSLAQEVTHPNVCRVY